jgi:hypothetical protein
MARYSEISNLFGNVWAGIIGHAGFRGEIYRITDYANGISKELCGIYFD